MKNYSNKFIYLYNRQRGICPACGEPMPQFDATLQHGVAKSKTAIKSYPLFINSLLNLSLIHSACNTTKHRSYGRRSYWRAGVIEYFLQRHPKICKFVNCE